MNPETYGYADGTALRAGALDVYFAPIYMKKNRPGTLLSVIAPATMRQSLTEIVLTETTSLGFATGR